MDEEELREKVAAELKNVQAKLLYMFNEWPTDLAKYVIGMDADEIPEDQRQAWGGFVAGYFAAMNESGE